MVGEKRTNDMVTGNQQRKRRSSGPVINISATVNQNIVVQQGLTQPSTTRSGRPIEKKVEHIDLTFVDDAELSSDTEPGSIDEPLEMGRFDDDDYLDDDQLQHLLERWDTDTNKAGPAGEHPATVVLKDYNGLVPGMAVELTGDHLMRIVQIIRLVNGNIYLRGLYFKRLTDMESPFPQKEMELCWLVEKDAEGKLHLEKEVPVSAVLDIVNIVLTNHPWRFHFRQPYISYVCRLVWQKTAEKGEWIIRYLSFEEADHQARTPAGVIRQKWRGKTIPYGAEAVDINQLFKDQREKAEKSLKMQRQYSFGDAFCGAGGVSVGAWSAGLRVKYGIDMDTAACALPYVTIKDAIDNIPRLADNHDPDNIGFQDGKTRAPYDENTLAKTITCGGGEGNYHPSGLRPFTVRELACLQTFPVQYKFPTAYAKKQVGNSVPPRLAEIIYRAAIKSLQETDEKEYMEYKEAIVIH
ncbi:uncharacterized protein BHQ10_001101 [Talaromyces amestolkiae]|uniref:DNA (cytosine-5-)-methyltransferase n=1 Tax=Talaromyces amestolkiae TaxID=1196081 RepID=A0A364KNI0_TALAM|nr:uncharacterized protein BHQ10_001101 [Talaromyces amestolkiae]RAO65089.1 hypothetical protein BHQ10_001101 [Talaromyces amestolkiae]